MPSLPEHSHGEVINPVTFRSIRDNVIRIILKDQYDLTVSDSIEAGASPFDQSDLDPSTVVGRSGEVGVPQRTNSLSVHCFDYDEALLAASVPTYAHTKITLFSQERPDEALANPVATVPYWLYNDGTIFRGDVTLIGFNRDPSDDIGMMAYEDCRELLELCGLDLSDPAPATLIGNQQAEGLLQVVKRLAEEGVNRW